MDSNGWKYMREEKGITVISVLLENKTAVLIFYILKTAIWGRNIFCIYLEFKCRWAQIYMVVDDYHQNPWNPKQIFKLFHTSCWDSLKLLCDFDTSFRRCVWKLVLCSKVRVQRAIEVQHCNTAAVGLQQHWAPSAFCELLPVRTWIWFPSHRIWS